MIEGGTETITEGRTETWMIDTASTGIVGNEMMTIEGRTEILMIEGGTEKITEGRIETWMIEGRTETITEGRTGT